MIDLDGNTQKQLVPTGKKLTAQEKMVDEFTRLVFCFDTSYSMRIKVADLEEVQSFNWTPELLKRVRERLVELHARARAEHATLGTLDLDGDFDDDPSVDDDPVDEDTMKALMLDSEDSDEELKRCIVKYDLMKFFGIGVDWSSHRAVPDSRMGIVKKVASRIIEERVDKYPNTDIDIIRFNSFARLVRSTSRKAHLLKAIEQMHPEGGTNTMDALTLAVDRIEKKPSAMGAHHIVCVSDAEDYYAEYLRGRFIWCCRKHSITFDFMLITSTDEIQQQKQMGYEKEMHVVLRKICAATGGEFTVVTNAREIREKLYLQGMRLCLPPAK